MMCWKPEVTTASDPEDVYTGNALRFATEDEALRYARDLMSRWTAVRDVRATLTTGEATHQWDAATGLHKREE